MIENTNNTSNALIVSNRLSQDEKTRVNMYESNTVKVEKNKCGSDSDKGRRTMIKHFFQTIYNNDRNEFKSYFANQSNSPWEWLDADDDFTCLHRACYLNLAEFATIIFEEMARLSIDKETISKFVNKTSKKYVTAIHLASYRGNIEIINILIRNGADIEAKNHRGLGVLHMAAQGDQPSLLLFFREKYNFDLEEIDCMGNTPLHWAAYTGSECFINVLLSYRNLNVNQQENQGLTPLHLAVMSEKTKIIKKLIYYGAVLNIKDNKNRNAFDLAIDKNKMKIAEMIRSEQMLLKSYPKMLAGEFMLKSSQKYNYFIYTFFILHAVFQSITFFFILPHYQNSLLGFLYIISLLILICLYVIACVNDPGKVSNPELTRNNTKDITDSIRCKHSRDSHKLLLKLVENSVSVEYYCPYCVIKAADKSYIKHCFNCNVCVIGYDHHCDWINNCVGVNNIKIFIAFISYVLLNLFMHLFLTVYMLVFLKESNGEAQSHTSFPPFFEYLKNLYFYEKNAKIILASCVMIISIAFLLPVTWLWANNIKASLKYCSGTNRFYKHEARSNDSFFGNNKEHKAEVETDEEEEYLVKTNTFRKRSS